MLIRIPARAAGYIGQGEDMRWEEATPARVIDTQKDTMTYGPKQAQIDAGMWANSPAEQAQLDRARDAYNQAHTYDVNQRYGAGATFTEGQGWGGGLGAQEYQAQMAANAAQAAQNPQGDLAPFMDYLNVDTELSPSPEDYLRGLRTGADETNNLTPNQYGGYGNDPYGPIAPNPYGGFGNAPYGPAVPQGGAVPSVTPSTGGGLPGFKGSILEGASQGTTPLSAQIRQNTQNQGGANPAVDPGWGPETQYLAALGLGSGYQNPVQTYLARMYRPFRDIWTAQQSINAATGAGSPSWEEQIRNLGGGMQNVYGQSAQTLQRLLGMTAADRTTEGFNFEPQYGPFTGKLLTPDETGNEGGGTLQDLLQYGTAQRFGPIGSAWLSRRLPYLQQAWQQQQALGGQPTSFLDWLRARYGL